MFSNNASTPPSKKKKQTNKRGTPIEYLRGITWYPISKERFEISKVNSFVHTRKDKETEKKNTLSIIS